MPCYSLVCPLVQSGVGVSCEKLTLRKLEERGAFLLGTVPPSRPGTAQG